ncbi:unnamed protein product [Sphenostylis stenocarpa]|uniref:Uncharacterized protein n=1 Tax=Sphenostylis stenocarpa TaxID=92480 RepID=A0AA86SXJ4_9FABA|nr:unnamed protein product [Sphenostylis stenocarpa]
MGDLMQRIMEMIQAEQAAKGSNSFNNGFFPQNNGTSNSFNNHGSGPQDFKGATINSGQYAGNRNKVRASNHYGGRVINNSGTFNGNGNGGYIEGGFNSSTNNYYGRY